MLFKDTPYKVVQYLAKLSKEKVLAICFQNENYIRHLIDRKAIEENNKQFIVTKKFEEDIADEIETTFNKCSSFLQKYDLAFLETRYSIQEIEALIDIEIEKQIILKQEISFQNILTMYFGSSKHRTAHSNLSKAIKAILGIAFFPEESKDQQYISILYPKEGTQFIVLCENKNRLITPRQSHIEFWYAGGKNTKQLEFIPKPTQPIFYLFDWDYDGLEIYIRIKQKYFPAIKAFLPENPEILMVKQSDVKNHHSKWRNKKFLTYLNEQEKLLAEILLANDSIIEEQNILLTKDNLNYNLNTSISP